jgi:uncharacterized protein YbjT (DUF2867 family)
MKVVVFGATGTIGAVLVAALTCDHDVTAVSRSPEQSRDEHGLRWVRADVDDEQSVARAMEGVRSPTTCTRRQGWIRGTRATQRGRFARAAERLAPARSFTSAGSATTRMTSRHTYAADGRPNNDWPPARCP